MKDAPKAKSQRLLRLPQVLQQFPISRSAWWLGVKEGRYPKPVRISARAVAWRESEVIDLIDGLGALTNQDQVTKVQKIESKRPGGKVRAKVVEPRKLSDKAAPESASANLRPRMECWFSLAKDFSSHELKVARVPSIHDFVDLSPCNDTSLFASLLELALNGTNRADSRTRESF
jgi:predicted DNA-binding transcriptional regulator AlpA